MRYAHTLFLGLCTIALLGCSENQTSQETTSTTTATAPEATQDTSTTPATPAQDTATTAPAAEPTKATVTVDVINGYPEEFYGCACYFARTQQELKQEKYIYFNDYQQKALVSVNGARVSLTGTAKGDSLRMNSPYKDAKGRYEVTISIQKSQQSGEEVASKTGVMQVKDLKTGATQSVPFVGECGC